MFVKPCPNCGRQPKIQEGNSRNGKRFFLVGCPNCCFVIAPEHHWQYPNPYFCINDDVDNNYLYKEWNKRLVK